MKPNIDQLQDFLTAYNKERRGWDNISPVEMLYSFYIHHSPPEPDTLRSCHKAINHLVEHLSFKEQDGILCAVNALCAEQERCALLDGIHLGAQLMLELTSEG